LGYNGVHGLWVAGITKAKSDERTTTQADGTIPGLTITVSKTGLAA
jgi:hypothetical protein